MINFLNKPYQILLTVAIICLLIKLSIIPLTGALNSIFEFKYFNIDFNSVGYFLATFNGILSIIYWKLQHWELNSALTKTHLILNFASILILVYWLYYFVISTPSEYSLFGIYPFWELFMTLFILFFFAQISLILNLIISYRKRFLEK